MTQAIPVMYGIPNCDTIKKARKWMQQHNIDYQFHDYKKLGVDETRLHQWLDQLGWEQVINKRGTSWRKLDESVRNGMDNDKAISVILENPSIIKRPLLEYEGQLTLGFKEAQYQELLIT